MHSKTGEAAIITLFGEGYERSSFIEPQAPSAYCRARKENIH